MGKLYLSLDSICWLWVFGKYLVVRDGVTLCVLILQSFEPPTWSLTELRVWDSTEADLSRLLWCVPRAQSKDNDVLTSDLEGWVGLLYQSELKSWHRFTEKCYLFTSDERFISTFISTNTVFLFLSNSSLSVVTFQQFCIYCCQTQQYTIAIIDKHQHMHFFTFKTVLV